MEEIWKDIKGYEGSYQVSNFGRVKSVKRKRLNKHGWRTVPERILKQGSCRGYCIVNLQKDNKGFSGKVHRLVAEAFLPNPDNLPCVNHKDENKANNNVTNLEWCDWAYNNRYGTMSQRVSKTLSKEVNQYTKDGKFLKKWDSAKEAAEYYKGTRENIQLCCNGRGATAFGYVWRYVS